ncbi:LCP family glycopolymer transferase [Lactobacillus kitasatonis]|uniref:LCP family glycopolymer transferase n=1 Tax=Lactobacillus kitasatonis TaxID=237446 RepID=UPI0026EF0059|nr:LCP family protein [Lactobacillus kitasatonis]
MSNKEIHLRHKRQRKALRIVLSFVGALVLATAIAFAVAYKNVRNTVNAMYAPATMQNKGRNLDSILAQKQAINVMLVGVDSKKSAQTVILMNMDPKTNTTKATAVNSAKAVYDQSGVASAAKAVSSKTNSPVDAYMSINVDGLKKSIDKIGGITVNGTKMNGEQAVSYMKVQSESERNSHILDVLKALLKDSASVSTLFNNDFLDSLGNEMQTSLNAGQLSKIATGYAHAAENVNTNQID